MTIEEANKFLQDYKKSNNLSKDNFADIKEKSEEYYEQFGLVYDKKTDIVKLEQANLIYAFNKFIEETGKFSVSYFLDSTYYKTHFFCKHTKDLNSKRAADFDLEDPLSFILDFANMGQKNEEKFSDGFNNDCFRSFVPADMFKNDLKLLNKGLSNIRKLTNGAFIPVLIPQEGLTFADYAEGTLNFVYDKDKMKPKELLNVMSKSATFDINVGDILGYYDNPSTVFRKMLNNKDFEE